MLTGLKSERRPAGAVKHFPAPGHSDKPASGPSFSNHLLATMPPDLLLHLVPLLRRVELTKHLHLQTPGGPSSAVYFIESGVVSLTLGSGEMRMEVGLVGREGIVGTTVLYAVDQSPPRAEVLIPGSAWRIDAVDLSAVLVASPILRRFLGRVLYIELAQARSNALAVGRLAVEGRLARWLLMMDDRLPEGRIEVVQHDVGDILGVRRPGVSVALKRFSDRDLVDFQRGCINVRRRSGLIEVAQGTYGSAESEYARLLGEFRVSGRRPLAREHRV